MHSTTVYTLAYACLAFLVCQSEQVYEQTENVVTHTGTGFLLPNIYVRAFKSRALRLDVSVNWYETIIYRYDVDENSNFTVVYTIDKIDCRDQRRQKSTESRSVNFCYEDNGSDDTQDGSVVKILRKILGVQTKCPVKKEVYDVSYIHFSLKNERMVYDEDFVTGCIRINMKLPDGQDPPTYIYDGSLFGADP